LRRGWTEIGRYVKDIDPYHHPLTIHPTQNARDQVEDDSILDLEMLQTGHSDRRSIPRTLRQMQEAYQYQPRRPVLNSEVCYEGIGAACREEVQRFMFWICLLNGACGHTYGANGIWQVNRSDRPYGASPHGMAWGHTPWPEAAQLPGSKQLGFSKNLLENYAWWSIEPHPEWVYPQPQDSPDMIYAPYAGGVPGKLRLIFLPSGVWNIIVQALEAESSYQALLFNPVTGETQDLGPVEPDETGRWSPPLDRAPIFQDWILVLEAQ